MRLRVHVRHLCVPDVLDVVSDALTLTQRLKRSRRQSPERTLSDTEVD